MARRIRAPNSLLPTRGGGGGPVALGRPPTQPLMEEDELIWDDGSKHPEYCIDEHSGHYFGKYEALGWLAGGLGVLGLIGTAASFRSQNAPFVRREMPFDGLKAELGKGE
ncbi:hypothetical protein WJX74_003890 [Apatococcus lobatus]|uniref:Uncharacterized protein n=1 Tax=Apatococcus lobatus TaxID=904363 RepID=A0AAW1SAR4_9CHLO